MNAINNGRRLVAVTILNGSIHQKYRPPLGPKIMLIAKTEGILVY